MCGSSENSVFENVIDTVLQVGTLGTLGFNGEDDSITGGVIEKGVEKGREGLKIVTGAAAAEQANELARSQFEEEKANRLREREAAREQNTLEQLELSRRSGAARRPTGSKSSIPSNRFSNLGDTEGDFLGL